MQDNKELSTQNISLPKRHIAFTEPGLTREPPARLTRAPTPYPKDFQRYQRSLNNQLRRNRDGSTASINLNIDASISQIKEAKVTPMKETVDTCTDNKEIYIKNKNAHHEIINSDNHIDRSKIYDKQYMYITDNDLPMDYYCSNFNDKISPDDSEQLKISLELQEGGCSTLQGSKQPPPYHIAAVYSKNAKYFNHISDSDKSSPVEMPKHFTQEFAQNISIPQPLHFSKHKDVDEHFIKELNKRLLNTNNQSIQVTKLVQSSNESMNYGRDDKNTVIDDYRNTNMITYKENTSNNISDGKHVPKLVRVTLTPCCYVLGFSVIYNENVSNYLCILYNYEWFNIYRVYS